jgi:hypothetical protein
MAEMPRTIPVAALAAEFDDFLFEPIGEERNGMLLSVVSALARLNLDPWQEAANLTQLPEKTAACRLSSLIAALPDRPSTHLDPASNAVRLIAHLPRRVGFKTAPVEASHNGGGRAGMQPRTVQYIAIIIMFLVGGLGIVAGELAAAQAKRADVPAFSTVISSTPSTSGQ